jgi:hypothetical protein
MNPPTLAAAPVVPGLAQVVADVPSEALLLFEAQADGVIAGRAVRRGDLLACRRDRAPTGPAILLPRGKGRPIAGAVHGEELRGAWGEPCHPERWEAAGPVVAWIRRLGRAWRVIEAWDNAPQLPLFQAA